MCGGDDPIFSAGWNWDFDTDQIDENPIYLIRPFLSLPDTYVKVDSFFNLDIVAGVGWGSDIWPIVRQFVVDLSIEGVAKVNVEVREGEIVHEKGLTSLFSSPEFSLLSLGLGFLPIDISLSVAGVYRYTLTTQIKFGLKWGTDLLIEASTGFEQSNRLIDPRDRSCECVSFCGGAILDSSKFCYTNEECRTANAPSGSALYPWKYCGSYRRQ